MAHRRHKSNDEETSYWLSYSDMMAALFLIFVLIISFTMLQSKKQYEEKEKELLAQQTVIENQKNEMEEQKELFTEQKEELEKQKSLVEQQGKELAEQKGVVEQQKVQMDAQQKQLDKIIGVRSQLITALRDEFEGSELSVYVDPQSGAITFDSSVLFDKAQFAIKDEGELFLNQFLPRYFNVLLKDEFQQYISEIIIEGHTDTTAGYIYNLELSQQRALSVAKYCLDENLSSLSKVQIEELQKILTANGRSFSNPIYNEDGSVNMEASRRVEFKFRLKDDEMVDEMIKILEGTDKVE